MLHVIHIEPDAEVMETITARARELGIEHGAIVSIIGAVQCATISNMKRDDALADVLTEYTQPMELCAGSGEIRAGSVHVHVVLGTEGDAALAGHLHRAVVDGNFFVRAYVQPL